MTNTFSGLINQSMDLVKRNLNAAPLHNIGNDFNSFFDKIRFS